MDCLNLSSGPRRYWYLRDETPEDSRVLAWWDYGYQINGIGNRTTLADGNTWNHEHIALVGRVLVSEEEHAYEIAQHLADYVLVWTTKFAGMRGDDLAKMPHMARIAASVFDDINGPGCVVFCSAGRSCNVRCSGTKESDSFWHCFT